MIPADLMRGDLLQVEWADITEDSNGNPDKPVLAHRHSIGFFWAIQTLDGVETMITTTTMEDDDGIENSGYCAYPTSVVIDVEVIKRKRRKRAKREGAKGQAGPRLQQGKPAGRDLQS